MKKRAWILYSLVGWFVFYANETRVYAEPPTSRPAIFSDEFVLKYAEHIRELRQLRAENKQLRKDRAKLVNEVTETKKALDEVSKKAETLSVGQSTAQENLRKCQNDNVVVRQQGEDLRVSLQSEQKEIARLQKALQAHEAQYRREVLRIKSLLSSIHQNCNAMTFGSLCSLAKAFQVNISPTSQPLPKTRPTSEDEKPCLCCEEIRLRESFKQSEKKRLLAEQSLQTTQRLLAQASQQIQHLEMKSHARALPLAIGNSSVRQTLKTLEGQLQQSQKRVGVFTKQTEALKEKITQLQEDLTREQGKHQSEKKAHDNLKTLSAAQQTQLREQGKLLENLRSEISTLFAQVNKAHKEADNLRFHTAQYKRTNSFFSPRETYNRHPLRTADTLTLETLVEELKQATAKIRKIRNQLSQTRTNFNTRANDYTIEISSLKAEINRLNKKLQQKKTEINKLSDGLKQMGRDYARANADLTHTRVKLVEEGLKLMIANQRIEQLKRGN